MFLSLCVFHENTLLLTQSFSIDGGKMSSLYFSCPVEMIPSNIKGLVINTTFMKNESDEKKVGTSTGILSSWNVDLGSPAPCSPHS